MTKKVAIYARYSTDLQREASIEDQIRVCEERAEKEGWELFNCYTDHSMSGASMMRPGIQQLMQDAAAGKFNVVLAEALDRLSRDQEDIAGIYKRLSFAGIEIVTLSEGNVGLIDVGLKGVMNQLFLIETANKVRRGMRGRAEHGKVPGGLGYGYEVVKKFDENGEQIRGERKINQEHADIIRRIHAEYVAGYSPRAIAKRLNEEGIPGPKGKNWLQSSINGNRRRGVGILNNEAYIGIVVWNRQTFIKDPDTGKRVPRFNPEEEWIRKEVPELRIVDQEIWDQVKARQRDLPKRKDQFWKSQRPKLLFTGLLKCGCCGGNYVKKDKERYACSTRVETGKCSNTMRIKQTDLESHVLHALQKHLMDPDLCEVFCEEYVRHSNDIRMQKNKTRNRYIRELQKIERRRKYLVECIMEGVPAKDVKDEIISIGNRRDEVEALLEQTAEEPVLLHPKMALHYRKIVGNLIKALNSESKKKEATELIRSLIDKVVLTPSKKKERLIIDLHGDLAGILDVAMDGKSKGETGSRQAAVQQIKLVAEEGLEPPTYGL